MALSKILELGIPKWIDFYLTLVFLDSILTPNVYTKKVGNHLIILVLYVDDLILTGSDPKLLTHVKSSLKQNFEMSDLGHLHYFLGLQVLQTKDSSFFPSLSMLVIFFVASTWKIVNHPVLPSSLESNFLALVLPLK